MPMGGQLPATEILLLNWRDTGHPEGGGSEVYVEQLADGLAGKGHRVTLFTARYPGSAGAETRPSGVRVIRRGNRFSLYPRAALAYWLGRLGRPAVIVEVQNGMPFLARAWARSARVLVLVHHVHREQWPVVMPVPLARVGWWLESRVAPRVNRGARYVTVSEATRSELAGLGISAHRIAVIHNGNIHPPLPDVARSEHPSLLVLGRLVPHKRIEIALQVTARLAADYPRLELVVAGQGWWEPKLRHRAAELGITDRVRFVGHVSDAERHRLLATSWISLVPSLKEGWGLVVVEAGAHGTPSIGFDGAGGLSESIVDEHTGLLARHDDVEHFLELTATLLCEDESREQLGKQAAIYATRFTWESTVDEFERQLAAELAGPSGGPD